MRKGLISALIVFCFCPYLARGEPARSEPVEEVELARADAPAVSLLKPFPANCSVPPPDISGWEVAKTSRIEFRLSDETVAYLGMDVLYATHRNSPDPREREFVQVISRHVPGIFSARKLTNERLFSQAVAVLYTQKDREDFFSEIEKKTNPILYVHWRVKNNPHTGRDMKDGDVDVLFLQSNGWCLSVQNERVGVQFLTENAGNGKLRNVFVGVKYQLGDSYHILKIDRRDLIQLVEGGK